MVPPLERGSLQVRGGVVQHTRLGVGAVVGALLAQRGEPHFDARRRAVEGGERIQPDQPAVRRYAGENERELSSVRGGVTGGRLLELLQLQLQRSDLLLLLQAHGDERGEDRGSVRTRN